MLCSFSSIHLIPHSDHRVFLVWKTRYSRSKTSKNINIQLQIKVVLMQYKKFRQMAALEPSAMTFRYILKCNPKLSQVPLGTRFPSQHNSILFGCMSTGSSKVRKPYTFPYASTVTFLLCAIGHLPACL